MPYTIRKLPNRQLYRVRNPKTGRVLAKATTLKKAQQQVRLLGYYVYTLKKNPDSVKKFKVTFPDGRSVKFGARGYSDYTIHQDKERMERYLARHRTRENWTKKGIRSAGFWARWILWSDPTLKKAINTTETEFGINVRLTK